MICFGEVGPALRLKSPKIDLDELLPQFYELQRENFDVFIKEIKEQHPDLLVYAENEEYCSITAMNKFLRKLNAEDESIGNLFENEDNFGILDIFEFN